MPQMIPYGMDELQTHTNPTFKPFGFQANVYSSSDSSSTSSKKSLSIYAEVESSDTVIMLVIMMEVVTFKKQLASMKATLHRLSNDSVEKNTQIKRQNEQIAELTKMLQRRSSEDSNKDMGNEDSDNESNRNTESDHRSIGKKKSDFLQYQYKNLICFPIFFLIYFRFEISVYKFLAHSAGPLYL